MLTAWEGRSAADGGDAAGPRRQGVVRWAPPIVATAAQLSLFLPWLRTGSTRRSAFGVLAALRSAGLIRPIAGRAFFVAIAILPGLVAASWLLATARLPSLAAATAATAGLLVAGTALTVRHVARHRATNATTAAVAAGGVAIVASVSMAAVAALSTHRFTRPLSRRRALT